MIGAIVGDIVGSRFEFDNIKSKDFELFTRDCCFTDDTVLTIAVGKAMREVGKNPAALKKRLISVFHDFGERYPDVGYGGRYADWLENKRIEPYFSCGNGSAMRASAAGWFADSLEEAERLGELSAAVTHNHPEGIKGAKAVAGAIFLARKGEGKETIKHYINMYHYRLDFTLDEIRPYYDFDETCQNSVPQALVAFFESESFEDAIRNAISIGGDSDTIACITGSIAEAYYGIDEDIKNSALSFLDDFLLGELEKILKAI